MYDWIASGQTFLEMLACIESLQFVCCCQRLNFTASKHFEFQMILGNPHNWRMRNSRLSRDLLRTFACTWFPILAANQMTNQVNIWINSHWTTTVSALPIESILFTRSYNVCRFHCLAGNNAIILPTVQPFSIRKHFISNRSSAVIGASFSCLYAGDFTDDVYILPAN